MFGWMSLGAREISKRLTVKEPYINRAKEPTEFVIDSVSMLSFEIDAGTVYYKIIVNTSNGSPSWELRGRYSEFADASDEMNHGRMKNVADMHLNIKHRFPSKDMNNKFYHFVSKTEDELDCRRKELQSWLQERIDLVKRGNADRKWKTEKGVGPCLHKMKTIINRLLSVAVHYGKDGDKAVEDVAHRPSKYDKEDLA